MPPFLSSRNRRLYIKITPLVENREEASVLIADVAAAAATISVANINKFAINKILLIGELGEEQSEIVKTHASTAPTGSTVTLAANTVFAHPSGTKVYEIEFDQIELSHATTVGGSKTLLTLNSGIVSIEADELEQIYRELEFTSGYYYARFKNSIGATFSDYTDAIPFGGFAENTIGYMIEHALSQLETEFDESITLQWFMTEANLCLKNIQGKLKRWPKQQNMNADIGDSAAGDYRLAMPTDAYDQDTNKSLIALRLGNSSDLEYLDADEFEQYIAGMSRTTVNTQASTGATSLILDSANDLADSGSVDIWVSNIRYNVTYTAITRATNTLTGIPASGTGAIAVTTPAASVVYQNAKFGAPRSYTIRNSYIEFYPIISADYDYKNWYADYWTVATSVNSETDVIDADRYDMVLSWLIWKLRCKVKNEGKLDLNDGDYLMYKEILNDSIRTSVSGQKSKMRPKLNGINYNRTSDWKRSYRGPTK